MHLKLKNFKPQNEYTFDCRPSKIETLVNEGRMPEN